MVYCDDIFIFTNSEDEEKHMTTVLQVFFVFKNMTTEVCKREITFLSATFNGRGWQTSEKYLGATERIKKPTTFT